MTTTQQARRIAAARSLGFAQVNENYVRCGMGECRALVSVQHPGQIAAHAAWHQKQQNTPRA